MMRLWHNHSLTIVLALIGIGFLIIALFFDRDHKGWDIFLGLFHACVGVALLNLLAGPFRERNKPEDPPKTGV